MRIGMVCYSTYGGSGVLASELGKLLANRDHVIHFVTHGLPFRLRNTYNENIVCHQVDGIDYPLLGDTAYPLALASRLVEIVRSENLDLLHVHYAIPHAASAILAAEMLAPAALPIVTTLHGTDVTLVGQDPGLREMVRFCLNRSTMVTAVSDYLREVTLEAFHPEREIRRIHNFVDLDYFCPPSEPRPRLSCCRHPDKVVFLHMSNFRKVKRTPDVVRIFAKVHDIHPHTDLLLAGEGPELPQCRALVTELGLGGSVHFLGSQEDIVSTVHLADVVLFPSETESFGLVPLEAMACGIPVVASNAGGLPEVITDQVTGFLAPVGDIDAMATYAIRLAGDPALRKQMGAAGRKKAETVFPPALAISQYERVYQDALESMPANRKK